MYFLSRVNCLNLAGMSTIETSFMKSPGCIPIIAVGVDLDWWREGFGGIRSNPLN